MRPFTLILVVLLAFLQASCATSSKGGTSAGETSSDADARFAALAKRWLDGTMQRSPISATATGDHRFDAQLDDIRATGISEKLAFYEAVLAELATIPAGALSREDQVDAAVLRSWLELSIWTTKTLRPHRWDPLIYNEMAGGAIYSLMARDFAPLEKRLVSAVARMEKLPAFLAEVRKNLVPAEVPPPHAATVAKQNPGILKVVDELVTPHLGTLPAPVRARADAAIAGVRAAVAEHQAWIEGVLVPGAKGDFRLGAAKYDRKLALALDSPLRRQEIRDRAEREITRVRGEMYRIAQKVLAGKPGAPALPEVADEAAQQKAIEAALELAYADRPTAATLVEVAKKTLADATAFVRERELVTMPEAPVRIILMPEFQRGVAVAYCDSPGPLDRHLETYYAISPIPDGWSAKQTESFLREYNTRMLHLLSIHEGVPGHFLEGAHSARHPSLVRAVLRSYVFAEGWAVYTEDMLADAGYLGGDPLFRLVQLKFYLRAIANAILDQGVHVDGWTREQAMDLMVRRTFQQESEAAGKWVRAQLSATQLPTYFVGVQELFDLRKEVEAREGAKFDARRYHDAVLSHGGPPVRHIRALMLGEPIR